MEYGALVDLYERLAGTASNNEKRDLLAAAFADADPDLLDRLVTLVRGRLGPAYDRPELGVSSSLTLDAIRQATGASEAGIRERWKETGDLGDAAAWAADNGGQQTLLSRELTVERVHDTLLEVATYEGAGSRDRKVDALAGLVADADSGAARYVVRTALGHLRVGVGEGTIRDAIAVAFLAPDDADGTAADGPSEDAVAAVERAYQVTTDFGVVAATARDDGVSGLAELDVELGRPVGSMLAEKAESLAEGLASAAPERVASEDARGAVRCEYKYDGVRVQVHVDGEDVTLFTRRLEDVTEQFPDVVAAVREGATADRALLDGELVGYEPDSLGSEAPTPVAFQELSQRVRRERDVDALAREVPVVCHLFDCLYDDDGARLDDALARRLDALAAAYDPVEPRPSEGVAGLAAATSTEATPDEPGPAEALYREALDAGHEGLMCKNPSADYQPGRRVGRCLKFKPTMEHLDLVVTRAKYSEGRRSELLGRLYLACYDPDADAFREVGRLSTGYTDEELEALTDRLEALVRERDGRDVELDHEVVLEVAYEELQESPEYGSGFALRFPRFEGVREDLAPTDADTADRVRSLYESQ